MDQLKNLSLVLVGVLVLPWIFMVAVPSCQMRALTAQATEAGNMGVAANFYPGHQVFEGGAAIYRSEGCAYCHTQVLRDPRAGDDIYKRGWGREQGLDLEKPEEATYARASLPQDYLGEHYAPIGLDRVGPDLSNVGYRRPDRDWHHRHLYQPRTESQWSTMPPMKHLYELRKIDGQPSSDALQLNEKYAVEEGYEVVPTEEAEILVQYLLSLKRDSPAPLALLPEVTLDEGETLPPQAEGVVRGVSTKSKAPAEDPEPEPEPEPAPSPAPEAAE